jgi:hypothetical protein
MPSAREYSVAPRRAPQRRLRGLLTQRRLLPARCCQPAAAVCQRETAACPRVAIAPAAARPAGDAETERARELDRTARVSVHSSGCGLCLVVTLVVALLRTVAELRLGLLYLGALRRATNVF